MTRPSLAHDATDDAYGEAMVRCQGYAPACSDAGECQKDGFCFSGDGAGFKRARRIVQNLIENEADLFTRCWLKVALEAMDADRFMSRKTLDAMRYVQAGKKARELYGLQD